MQLRFRGTVCTAGQVRYGAVEPDVTILTKSVSGVTTFPLTRHADEVRFRSTARWSAANHRSPWFHVNNATTSTAAAVRFRRAGLPRNSRSGIESLSERSSRKMAVLRSRVWTIFRSQLTWLLSVRGPLLRLQLVTLVLAARLLLSTLPLILTAEPACGLLKQPEGVAVSTLCSVLKGM